MKILERIDTLKTELQVAKQALHEADNWTVLATDLEEVLINIPKDWERRSSSIKRSVFRDITLCSPEKVKRCFGITYCPHLQG
jgi:hypothetical protein